MCVDLFNTTLARRRRRTRARVRSSAERFPTPSFSLKSASTPGIRSTRRKSTCHSTAGFDADTIEDSTCCAVLCSYDTAPMMMRACTLFSVFGCATRYSCGEVEVVFFLSGMNGKRLSCARVKAAQRTQSICRAHPADAAMSRRLLSSMSTRRRPSVGRLNEDVCLADNKHTFVDAPSLADLLRCRYGGGYVICVFLSNGVCVSWFTFKSPIDHDRTALNPDRVRLNPLANANSDAHNTYTL